MCIRDRYYNIVYSIKSVYHKSVYILLIVRILINKLLRISNTPPICVSDTPSYKILLIQKSNALLLQKVNFVHFFFYMITNLSWLRPSCQKIYSRDHYIVIRSHIYTCVSNFIIIIFTSWIRLHCLFWKPSHRWMAQTTTSLSLIHI